MTHEHPNETGEREELERWSAEWRAPQTAADAGEPAPEKGAAETASAAAADRTPAAGPDPAASGVSPAELRRRLRRQSWWLAANWAAGLALVIAATAWAWVERTPTLTAAAVAVWLLVGAAVGFDLHYRRGTWRAAGRSTLDYLGLAVRRHAAYRRGLRFAWALLGAEVLFFLIWIPWTASREPDYSAASGFGLLAVLVAVFAAGIAWLQSRARQQAARLEALRRQLEGPEAA